MLLAAEAGPAVTPAMPTAMAAMPAGATSLLIFTLTPLPMPRLCPPRRVPRRTTVEMQLAAIAAGTYLLLPRIFDPAFRRHTWPGRAHRGREMCAGIAAAMHRQSRPGSFT